MKADVFTIDWELVGARFANADSNIQEQFLRGAIKEWRTWESRLLVEKQLCAVNLSKDEKRELEGFAGILTYVGDAR